MVDAPMFSLNALWVVLLGRALVEAAFLFGGRMDEGFERGKGHGVVIAQERGYVKAARSHEGLRKKDKGIKGYTLLLTKLCTTRHCGIAHTATTKGCPTEHSAPKSCPDSFSSPPGRSLGPRPTPSRERAGHRRDAFMGLSNPLAYINKTYSCSPVHFCVKRTGERDGRFYTFLQLYSSIKPRDTPFRGPPAKKKKINQRECGTPSAHRPQQSTPTDKSKGPRSTMSVATKNPFALLDGNSLPSLLQFTPLIAF